MYSELVNAFSATRAGSWLVRNFATKIDPILFRASGGRFTSTGIPTLPMLTLSAVGRKSGELRHVQLAFYQDGEDYLVVASAMGQDRHPGWRYNIEANPAVELQVRGERFPANARVLDEDEKARLWPETRSEHPPSTRPRSPSQTSRLFASEGGASPTRAVGSCPSCDDPAKAGVRFSSVVEG